MVHIYADKASVEDNDRTGVAQDRIDKADHAAAHVYDTELDDRRHGHRNDDERGAYVSEYFKKNLIVINKKFHIDLQNDKKIKWLTPKKVVNHSRWFVETPAHIAGIYRIFNLSLALASDIIHYYFVFVKWGIAV
jgi:hypothetical protein